MKCQMTRAGAKHLLTRKSTSWLMALGCLIASPPPMKSGEPGPEPHLVERAIRKGTEFIGFAAVPKAGFHEFYTADLQSGHSGCSEKHTDFCVETIWRMGGTFLDAHRITTDPIHLKAAEKCAETLIVGQRQSGGWARAIHMAPADRREVWYLNRLDGSPVTYPDDSVLHAPHQGWHDWRIGKFPHNTTLLEGNATPAALLFLIRFDEAKRFSDARIHQAIEISFNSLLNSQYPNGGWSAHYDRFLNTAPIPGQYTVKGTSLSQPFPPEPKLIDEGCHVIRDGNIPALIRLLLEAYRIYGKDSYLEAAKRTGEFLIQAQLPSPYLGWVEQYDAQMRPTVSKGQFAGPSTRATLEVIEGLHLLRESTGEERFMVPIIQSLRKLNQDSLPEDLKTKATQWQQVYLRTGARTATPQPRTSSRRIGEILEKQDPVTGAWVSDAITREGARQVELQTFLQSMSDLLSWIQTNSDPQSAQK